MGDGSLEPHAWSFELLFAPGIPADVRFNTLRNVWAHDILKRITIETYHKPHFEYHVIADQRVPKWQITMPQLADMMAYLDPFLQQFFVITRTLVATEILEFLDTAEIRKLLGFNPHTVHRFIVCLEHRFGIETEAQICSLLFDRGLLHSRGNLHYSNNPKFILLSLVMRLLWAAWMRDAEQYVQPLCRTAIELLRKLHAAGHSWSEIYHTQTLWNLPTYVPLEFIEFLVEFVSLPKCCPSLAILDNHPEFMDEKSWWNVERFSALLILQDELRLLHVADPVVWGYPIVARERRFIRIGRRLPMELQILLCVRLCGFSHSTWRTPQAAALRWALGTFFGNDSKQQRKGTSRWQITFFRSANTKIAPSARSGEPIQRAVTGFSITTLQQMPFANGSRNALWINLSKNHDACLHSHGKRDPRQKFCYAPTVIQACVYGAAMPTHGTVMLHSRIIVWRSQYASLGPFLAMPTSPFRPGFSRHNTVV